jgi:arsenite methyltransferase
MAESAPEIRRMVRERFTRLAGDPAGGAVTATGPSSAVRLGYTPAEISDLPARAVAAFTGVGNPVRLGDPRPGEVVIDLGCGSGTDAFLAASRVGPEGRVIGLDLTPALVGRARLAIRDWRGRCADMDANGLHIDERPACLQGTGAIPDFVVGDAEAAPFGNGTADLVLSNGVFNLCFDKPAVLRETARVLRSRGRLAMADILLEDHLTPEEATRKGAWSD